MKESLGTNQCGLADDAHEELRRLIDTTPALIHTGRADGYLDYSLKREKACEEGSSQAFFKYALHERRARDSNPQPVSRHLISSQAANHSLTLRGRAPIKYEPQPGGKVSGLIDLVGRRRSDLSDGAVGTKDAGALRSIKVASGRPCYAVWTTDAGWCKKRGRVGDGLRRNSECNDLQRDSSRAQPKHSLHVSTCFRADSR